MSTKPTTPFTWATDANYASIGNDWDGEPTKVAPTSGLRAEGFEPATKPAADVFNHILNHIGEWVVYLDDGEFEGPIQITGGELQVDEITDAGAGHVEFLGGVVVQGDITAQGDLKHGDRVLNIPGSAGRANSNTTLPLSGYEGSIASTGATTITWQIPLKVGDRIKQVVLRTAGDGAADFTALDVMVRNGGVLGSLAFNTDPADNTPVPPTVTVLTANVSDYTLVAGDVIVVGVVINATGMIIYSVEVTYDRP